MSGGGVSPRVLIGPLGPRLPPPLDLPAGKGGLIGLVPISPIRDGVYLYFLLYRFFGSALCPHSFSIHTPNCYHTLQSLFISPEHFYAFIYCALNVLPVLAVSDISDDDLRRVDLTCIRHSHPPHSIPYHIVVMLSR
jgi:hypothetical protein